MYIASTFSLNTRSFYDPLKDDSTLFGAHECHRSSLVAPICSEIFPCVLKPLSLCHQPSTPIMFPHSHAYQIPGNIENRFFWYFPPKSFLYLISFFFAQTPICADATTANRTVLQLQDTSAIPSHASASNM